MAVSTSETNRLKSSDIDADFKEGVSKLESDISKTIENNNKKLKEVEEEIEQLVHAKNAHISPLVESAVHEHEGIEIASKKPSLAVDYVLVEANEDTKEPLPTTTVLSSTEVPVETSTMTLAEIVIETVTPTTMMAIPTTVRPDMDSTVATILSTLAKVSLPLHLYNLT